jgi:subtilisin family serine protease
LNSAFRQLLARYGLMAILAAALLRPAVLDSASAQAFVVSPPPSAPRRPPALDVPRASGEIVVKFRSGAGGKTLQQIAQTYTAQAQAEPTLAQLGVAVLKVPEDRLLEVLAALNRDPAVAYAEPNYLLSVPLVEAPAPTPAPASALFRFYFPLAAKDGSTASRFPNDPFWPSQYGPMNVQALQAWNVTTGSNSVVIAVIDSGVDLNHPDLAGKVWTNPGESGGGRESNGIDDDGDGYVDDWRGWDFVAKDNDPQDKYGHGTHVAGIAAAASNNGVGIAGMAWGPRIMVLRVLNSIGTGEESDVATAILWAVNHGARIVNLSLGGPVPSKLMEDAVNEAYARGVTVVAAAGNEAGQGVIYPAVYPQAIAVASVGITYTVSSFSSFGPEVDVAAPGESVFSTYWTAAEGSTYRAMSGTSMAAPHVSGIAALLASLPQFDTPDKIRAALELAARDEGDPGWDELYGWGVVQAYSALLIVPSQITPTPVPPPPLDYAVTTSLTCPPGAAFNWLDATGGTDTGLHADDKSIAVPLPFDFVFNREAKTTARISTNGYLTFGSNGTAFENAPIPTTNTPNDFLAPFWDDLNPTPSGNIYYTTLGAAPDRRFVVQWVDVPRFTADPPNGAGALTFEIVLAEGSDDILFQYLALAGPEADGGSATVGIEFAKGAGGAQYAHNTPGALQNGLAIRFSPVDGAPPTPTPICSPTPGP